MLLNNFSWDKLQYDLSKKHIIFFGAGGALQTTVNFICRIDKTYAKNIKYIVDNDAEKWGKDIYIFEKAVKIISPDKLSAIYNQGYIVIITTQFVEEIIKQLSSYSNLKEAEIYFYDDIKICVCQQEFKIPKTFKRDTRQRIPKILHYCWFGRNKLPDDYVKWMESWRKYCSDYEIIEWNENNYDCHKNRYISEAYQAGKWGFVSDYARLDIVNTNGGIYLDTDVELVRNIDELLYQPAFFGIQDDGCCNTGLGFGAEAGFPLLSALMLDYENRSFVDYDGMMDMTVCPDIQTAALENLGYQKRNYYQIVENAAFLPAPLLSGFIGTELCMSKDVFSIHHAAWSWRDNISKADTILKARMLESEKKWRESVTNIEESCY